MNKYEIARSYGCTNTVEASFFEVTDTWVIFYGADGLPLAAYPAKEVERVATVVKGKKPGWEPVRITINSEINSSADAEEVAKITEQIIKRNIKNVP